MPTALLICDDSNMARKQVLRSLPDEWKGSVQTASNGEDALKILRDNSINVLFLDLTMPGIDGIGVLQGIQTLKLDCSVFVISADIQPEMQNKVKELGAKEFIRKPVQQDILLTHLQQHGLL